MPKFYLNLIAAVMLIFMLVLAFSSLLNDSAIMDEVAHLPAGYSYIAQQDMRLNPEHPPLIKDLSGGLVWLYSKITNQPVNFPYQLPAWQTDINGQWDFGFDFMYNEGNDADLMLFLGRLPMLLILLILGIYIFKWARELFGPGVALLSLFLYSFSPTFLAHGRFITTDLAAAAAIFIASFYFLHWLKAPTKKNLIIAGFVFGLAQLAKFSVFLLIPLFGGVALLWILLQSRRFNFWSLFWQNLWRYLGGLVILMVVGYVFIVWPVYLFHVANYPVERQQSDAQFILSSFGIRPIAALIHWLAGLPVVRALAQYGLGLAMVVQRAAGGNTTYFLGEVSAAGSQIYFPLVYLIKETIALHLLALVAFGLFLWRFFKQKSYVWQRFTQLLRDHIAEVLMLGFIVIYWGSSIRSPLNIGVRHVLPTFPFIFLLVSAQVVPWLKNHLSWSGLCIEALENFFQQKNTLLLRYVLVLVLLVWQVFSVVSVYPSFLAYFNELAGGPAYGHLYITDSNLDWGQDLKRLARWVNNNKIPQIYVDYFGGATAQYYLGDKFLPWWGTRSPQDLNATGGWLAVSATFLQGGRGKPAPGFKEPTGYYKWLDDFRPIITIGYSIFVYYIPPHMFDEMAQK